MKRCIVLSALVAFVVGCGEATPVAPAKHSWRLAQTAASSVVGGPQVMTDKSDYLPGDTIRISGSGWAAGEVVTLLMNEDPETHPPRTWSVQADANGTFADSSFEVHDDDFGVAFTLTATGQTSGLTATATFTDGQQVTAAPLTVKDAACATAKTSFALGNEICAATSVTVVTVNANQTGDFRVQWVNPSGILVRNTAFTDVVNASSHTDKFTPTVGGTWTLRTCQGASGDGCAGSNLLDTETFTVSASPSDLVIGKTHSGSFTAGQSGSYTISVSNEGAGATSGTVTVTDVLPAGLSATAISGTGWSCTLATLTCTRSDVLAAGGSYPPITVTVNVAQNAASSVTNVASVSGGGEQNTANDQASDVTSIGAAATTTVLQSSANPSAFGQSVTFTATVTSSGAAVSSGQVKFFSGTACAGTELKAATTVDADGKVTYTPSSLTVGTHDITACYLGGTGLATSNGSLVQTVNKAATTMVVGTSKATSYFGESVTFTATISVTSPGAGSPTGTVRFYDGGACNADGTGTGTQVGTGVITNGVATAAVTSLSAGSHTINGCYGGDGSFDGSADDVAQSVTAAVTQTVTASSPDPSAFGASVTFSATVSVKVGFGAGTPSGSVAFILGGTCASPTNTLGSDNLSSGVASISITSPLLTVSGSPHAIVACYTPANGNFAASQGSDSHTVTAAATNIGVTVSPNSQQYSDLVDLEATVTPVTLNGATISGTVQFSIGGNNVGTAQTVNTSTGKATLTGVQVLVAPVSSASVVATFTSTNVNFQSGTGSSTLAVTQEKATVRFPSNNATGANVSTPFTLQAIVSETYPETNASGGVDDGDISNTQVGMVLKDVLGGGSISPASCEVTTQTGSDYADTRTIKCSFGSSVPVGTYAVTVTVSGYYTGSGEDVFTVFDPSLGFTTGGGRYELNGERVNYGFTVKLNRKGAQPQGSVLVIRHHSDGTTTRAKSNVMSGLSINTDKSATFSGKTNYYDETGAWLGNLSFTAWVKDVAEPGTNADRFALYVALATADPNGPATSTSLVGVDQTAKTITGGNIQVPKP
jgi:uncharacterized repeat protein (TIGR01451 family)